MKRRLLPALLALVMVLSLLPVTALAADVNYGSVLRAPLVDHGPDGATGYTPITRLYDTTYSVKTTKTSKADDSVETYNVVVEVDNLRQHYRADHEVGYWAGVAIPQGTGMAYALGWGEYGAATVSWTNVADNDFEDNKVTYDSFYWPLGANSNKTGMAYLAVDKDGAGKDTNAADVVYSIDFTKVTLAVPFAVGFELQTKDAEGNIVNGGEMWKNGAVLGDYRAPNGNVTDKGSALTADALNEGCKVYAEAGSTGNEYNIKVEHDGLRVHANGAGKLGWWAGVAFPQAPEQDLVPTSGSTGKLFEITSFKKDGKSYTLKDIQDDAVAHGGYPTMYFDVAEGTSHTVEIGYTMNKATNCYKDKEIVVKYNIDLSGVEMLEGPEYPEYALTEIDSGTIYYQERGAGKTVKNTIGYLEMTEDNFEYNDEEDVDVKIGVAGLYADGGDDDIFTALGDSNYELEVGGVGKIYLDNTAVKSVKETANQGTANQNVMITMINWGSQKVEDDTLKNVTYTGTAYTAGIVGFSEDDQDPTPAVTETPWKIIKADHVNAVIEMSGDFGSASIKDTNYADLKPTGELEETVISEATGTTNGTVNLSFYAGKNLSLSNITVAGLEPVTVRVNNTNPAMADAARDERVKDYGNVSSLVVYDKEDLSYDRNTGYVTVNGAEYLDLYLVVVKDNGGGGSGGGAAGGGSGTPGTTPGSGGSTTPSQTVVKETVNSSTTGTTASANVTSTTMDRVVNSAVAQAAKAGNTPVVELVVPVGATAESLEVTLPTSSLGKLAETAGSELVISSEIATVELDHTALAALVASAGDNASVKLEVAPVDPDDLTGAQAEAVQALDSLLSETEVDAEIVDIALTVGDTAVHDYNNGSISVTLPFDLPTGATASDVRVYFLDDDGSLTRCTASYTNGKVTFVTNHLSKYIISAKALLPEASFTDVAEGDYFFDAVAWAVANGVTTGKTETIFDPNDGCTRAQIVTFLWRAYGEPASSAEVNFTDIDTNEYYYNAVKWAVEKGITTGTGDGTTFSPNQVCTRAEAVTFQKRAAGMNTMQGTASDTFTDVEAGAFYDSAVVWAVANGITTGTTATTFSPYDYCTRAQIVTFLYRQFA